MIAQADLLDIQGGVLNGYKSFSDVAHLFGTIDGHNVDHWREFLAELRVTAADWGQGEPASCLNVGVSARGVALLQPALSAELAGAFDAFSRGMAARAAILGDTQTFPAWEQRHVWLSVHARAGELEGAVAQLLRRAGRLQLTDDARGAALTKHGFRYEHFGFRDDISYPVLRGSPKTQPGEVEGRGKLVDGRWEPLLDGEFILGHENERGQNVIAGLSEPAQRLLRNGTFAVFRTLSQDVVAFRRYTQRKSGPHASAEFLASRMLGRLPSGEPLVPTTPPTAGAAPELSSFDYGNDPNGAGCPLGAHVRRANPRSKQNGGRHHLIRRGVSYGEELPHGVEDDRDRGVHFVAFNADLEDQFEFVQKQWMNGPVGNGSQARDPLVGAGPERGMVIEGDPSSGRRPILLLNIPSFVTLRGGQYYFYPGREGLRALCAPAQPTRPASLYEVSR